MASEGDSPRLAEALGLTALAYAVLPGYDALALSYIGRPFPLHRTGFASFISYAFSRMLGFPLLTGGSVRYRLWSSWGLGADECCQNTGEEKGHCIALRGGGNPAPQEGNRRAVPEGRQTTVRAACSRQGGWTECPALRG